MTQVAFRRPHIAYEHRRPRAYLATGEAGTLGAGVAHGIGAAAAGAGAGPSSPSSATAGCCSPPPSWPPRCSTASTPPCLLFDNGAYGNVQRLQRQRFGPDRTIASSLKNPEWIAFGESFGVRTERASGPETLPAVLEESLAHPGPSMVVVDIAGEPDPWPLLRLRR